MTKKKYGKKKNTFFLHSQTFHVQRGGQANPPSLQNPVDHALPHSLHLLPPNSSLTSPSSALCYSSSLLSSSRNISSKTYAYLLPSWTSPLHPQAFPLPLQAFPLPLQAFPVLPQILPFTHPEHSNPHKPLYFHPLKPKTLPSSPFKNISSSLWLLPFLQDPLQPPVPLSPSPSLHCSSQHPLSLQSPGGRVANFSGEHLCCLSPEQTGDNFVPGEPFAVTGGCEP